MKTVFLLLMPFLVFAQKWDTMQHNYTYLALGDSYTIGEGVPLHKSFAYQTVSILREAGYTFFAPETIAKTGWTTSELDAAVAEHILLPKYDFVTLLIGVNNQYRGRGIIEYKEQFEHLLKKSISLAGDKPEHVVVLSIPDYGVTPFGQRLDAGRITKEIDEYNTLNRALSIQYKVGYLDLTQSCRDSAGKASAVVADGLHPSEREYGKWAKKLAEVMKAMAKK